MGTRRKSRELAMQALYYMDMRAGQSGDMIQMFLDSCPPPGDALDFFLELIHGVLARQNELNAIIEKFSNNWKVSRMSCVDRNVLRLAAYELLFCTDIPAKVSINEAIDIGKKFGTEESGAFINGILDSIRIACENGTIEMPAPAPQSRPGSETSPQPDHSSGSSLQMKHQLHVNADGSADNKDRRSSIRLSPGIRKRPATRNRIPTEQGDQHER